MTAERFGWVASATLLAAFVVFAVKHARAPGADSAGRASKPVIAAASSDTAASNAADADTPVRREPELIAQTPAQTATAPARSDPDALDSTRLTNAKANTLQSSPTEIIGVIDKKPSYEAMEKLAFSGHLLGGDSQPDIENHLRDYARQARSAAARDFAPKLSAYKRNRKYPYVPILSLAVFPSRFLNKPVSSMGSAFFVNMQAAKPHFRLGDGHGVSASLPVNASRLTKEQKITLMHLESTHHFVGVFGTIRKTSEGEFFIEASALEDLGPFPTGSTTISQITDHPLNAVSDDRSTASSRTRAKAQELKRLRTHRFIRTTEFILDPQAYQGQRISLLGVPSQPVNSPSGFHFEIADTFSTQNRIEVLANRLPEAHKLLIFTLTFPPTVVALKGTVVRTRAGAVYVDAESVEAVSWWANTSVEGQLTGEE